MIISIFCFSHKLNINSAPNYICLDDLAARQKAQSLDLQIIGTIGILKLSHQLQHISAQIFLQYLDNLIQKHGMYLSPKLLYKLKQL
ncbi:DUF3368 domain-containing protein [Candidatus Albibeggiatoa sp. nov. BB20]|uniref:DUF3368 domain-containing protein n=1 Tax=Candidatus Albibeggiatoa sp. nov. BB20 TaxID=3162723 RepID=UPI0033659B75